ncbi:hypothetical protein KY325_02025 [Candidatus Woesearchaeota archaeon]|nr:hypothetical protein [Candidatus Woesearchaeota archaeon]MBW3017913.1 hypothetical protein [Candidatus Woesearchaeota archaeon]
MKIMLYICIFLLLFSIASAVSFDVDITPLKDKIFKNETAQFILKVKSNEKRDAARFDISSPNVITGQWVFLTNPLSDNSFILDPESEKEIELLIRPIGKSMGYGMHTVVAEVQSGETKVSYNLNVNLMNPEGYIVSYMPRVVVNPDPDYPKRIKPVNPIPVTVHLLNKNSLDIPKLVVKVNSNFFKDEKEIQLGPYEKADVSFTFEVDSHTLPQKDTMYIKLLVDNEVITAQEYDIEYIETELEFTEEEKVDKEFLKKKVTYVLTNPSNTKKTETFSVPVSILGRVVSSPYPKTKVVDGQYQWEVELHPSETDEFIVIYNYRTFMTVIAIILILVFVYQYFKPEIVVNKKAAEEFSPEDSTLTGAKVVLYLKNSTTQPLKNVSIAETIPNIATYVPRDILGSIKPEFIRPRDRGGSTVIWKLDEVAPKEERVITYFIKAKLKIVGDLKLPGTTISFTKGSKKKTVYSNSVKLSIAQ